MRTCCPDLKIRQYYERKAPVHLQVTEVRLPEPAFVHGLHEQCAVEIQKANFSALYGSESHKLTQKEKNSGSDVLTETPN